MGGKSTSIALLACACAMHATMTGPIDVVAEDTPRRHRKNLRRHDERFDATIDAPAEATRRQRTAMSASGGRETRGLAQRRLEKSCLGFYPNMEHRDGCVNDTNYPDAWTANDRTKKMMFHSTAEGCCQNFFRGAECKVYDTGCAASEAASAGDGGEDRAPPPSPKPSPEPTAAAAAAGNSAATATSSSLSSSCKWHPDVATKDGCTNDDNYPDEWKSSGLASNLFRDTPQECCDIFFRDRQCNVYDRGCRIEESIAITTGTPTAAITERPTAQPTHQPTAAPVTSPPTAKPSPKPTASPTETPLLYYMVHGVGTCVDSINNQMPYYITQVYDDFSTCCDHSFAKTKCLAEMPDPPKRLTKPDVPSEFFVPYGSSVCVDVNEPGVVKSYWQKNTYYDYDECCRESSPDVELCLESEPGRTPAPVPIPDTIIEVMVYGSVSVSLPWTPEYNSRDWTTLKSVFVKTITWVMAQSEIVVGGFLDVELHTFAGSSFQYRHQRRLDESGEVDGNPLKQTRRRASEQTLAFEMTIPARCDATCRSASDSGRVLYDALVSHWTYYVESGVFLASLKSAGQSLGLFDDAESAQASTGAWSLTYRMSAESSTTLFPTWSPTHTMQPSRVSTPIPSADPSDSPSTQPSIRILEPSMLPTPLECESADWHPLEDFSSQTCSNSFDYPGLWNNAGARSFFLFPTAEACCSFYRFPDCHIDDVCVADVDATMSTAGDSTSHETSTVQKVAAVFRQPLAPTESEPTSPPTTACSTNRWYFKRGPGFDVCINDKSYPHLWDIEPGLGGMFLFHTLTDCCAANRPGRPCPVKDVCDSPKSCSRVYHPTFERTCTNSLENYPPGFRFDNAVECCSAFYPDGLCFIKDVCS